MNTNFIISISLILVICFTVSIVTFYNEYKINRKLPEEDMNKETTFSLLCQCIVSGLVTSLFVGIPIMMIIMTVFN